MIITIALGIIAACFIMRLLAVGCGLISEIGSSTGHTAAAAPQPPILPCNKHYCSQCGKAYDASKTPSYLPDGLCSYMCQCVRDGGVA